jgi:hypothetical protein
MKTVVYKVRGIRREFEKGTCPRVWENKLRMPVMLSCPRNRRIQFISKTWLCMD